MAVPDYDDDVKPSLLDGLQRMTAQSGLARRGSRSRLAAFCASSFSGIVGPGRLFLSFRYIRAIAAFSRKLISKRSLVGPIATAIIKSIVYEREGR